MEIRIAVPADSAKILDLLAQVENIHHNGRPDIFRKNGTKFTAEELSVLMTDPDRPIFVAVIDGSVVGYVFCILGEIAGSPMLNDAKTLHIEDVCIDENCRGEHIGSELVEFIKAYAKSVDCTRIDLDVWEFNGGARSFYEKHGFKTQKRRMDIVL